MNIAEKLKELKEAEVNFNQEILGEVIRVTKIVFEAEQDSYEELNSFGCISSFTRRDVDFDNVYFEWEYDIDDNEKILVEFGEYERWNEFVNFPANLLGDEVKIQEFLNNIKQSTKQRILNSKDEKVNQIKRNIEWAEQNLKSWQDSLKKIEEMKND